ncbi:hypothetical protein [Caenimonas soli]|uniref:hypothetical protein n=1 Tax=Caenimonas soli TaxID=2735555 RepID=UPI001553B782|nr:hypothetical protein [Caenimonas soli]NPC56304.1 hypothetical protein [Caenimonas soli]
MGFFSKLLGDTPAPDQSAARRELLRVALRDTLNRHNIPATWIRAETLVTTSRGVTHKGLHWRLLIKHWHPELLSYGVPFQQSLINRLVALDASAATWLMGISWQFALPDESVCPPLPQRAWGAEPKAAAQPAKAATPLVAATTAPVPAAAATSAKADLEQMFAERDAQLKQTADDARFQSTEPAALSS